jgi:hypothetical protein
LPKAFQGRTPGEVAPVQDVQGTVDPVERDGVRDGFLWCLLNVRRDYGDVASTMNASAFVFRRSI